MDIFDVLTFIGGICLFLFGMSTMGKALEKRAGSGLKKIISKLTTNKFAGLTTGLIVTAIIQSSSATTVMVVGFVNSGVMSLGQSIGVIMGANIGTTVTSWILSLSGISSSSVWVQLLKPSSWSPILALIGIVLLMFCKDEKKKDTGMIFLGFATLMFGMETMTTSVSGLKDEEWFRNLFVAFDDNPFLGVLVGAAVTAIIQSSSASVGILQAFATTGQISFGSAIPIILGQNIGTCVTSLISSVGTNKNAKRASLVHLFFNIIGCILVLAIYLIVRAIWKPAILDSSATLLGIAIFHSLFNIFCVIVLFPCSKLLEKLVCLIIPDKKPIINVELDDRLLMTPSIALEQVRKKLIEMADTTSEELALTLDKTDKINIEEIQKKESRADELEDLLGTYMVKLSSKEIGEGKSRTLGEYLKIIGDLERITDHLLNIGQLFVEMKDKDVHFSDIATTELSKMENAITEVWGLTYDSLVNYDFEHAKKVEPLEQVIDKLNELMRNSHTARLQKKECNIDIGFYWAEILSNLERISDHCSNIAGCVIDDKNENMNIHTNINDYRHTNEDYQELYKSYLNKYGIFESVGEIPAK